MTQKFWWGPAIHLNMPSRSFCYALYFENHWLRDNLRFLTEILSFLEKNSICFLFNDAPFCNASQPTKVLCVYCFLMWPLPQWFEEGVALSSLLRNVQQLLPRDHCQCPRSQTQALFFSTFPQLITDCFVYWWINTSEMPIVFLFGEEKKL